ncbi:uncharacterized protein CC84DRAFT_453462 [Paraphaeosphaeria sporulosa]|uniref:Uncharacterized protein n=1 Tax=Paraphaeosphaeria sporulosa TaxID=1460663 RepID=A0A177CSP3_9PLEO|nr:uncharacterized protein CC84DRAFT_453462 [Paraphaeosphaeria sporulosa]OAG09769.1 hypothetical protein CC84DRAFT_453462 [Paraphaeosphaeria sporulosa]
MLGTLNQLLGTYDRRNFQSRMRQLPQLRNWSTRWLCSKDARCISMRGTLSCSCNPSRHIFSSKFGTNSGRYAAKVNSSESIVRLKTYQQYTIYRRSVLRPKLHTGAHGIVRTAECASPRQRSTRAKQPNKQNQQSGHPRPAQKPVGNKLRAARLRCASRTGRRISDVLRHRDYG